MYAVSLARQKRCTLTSDGWSKLASSLASLRNESRPRSNVAANSGERSSTGRPSRRPASAAGMYSLIATRRTRTWSYARYTMPNAPMPSTLTTSNSSSRVPGASVSWSAARLGPGAWRGSGTVVGQELSDIGLQSGALQRDRCQRRTGPILRRCDDRRRCTRRPRRRTRPEEANGAPERRRSSKRRDPDAPATRRASADDERSERNEAEPERGERVAGDQAAAEERRRRHVGRQRAGIAGRVATLAPRRARVDQARDDAAGTEPERRREVDEAAERERVRRRQHRRVEDEVDRAAAPRLLVAAPALAREDELADELDREAGGDAEPDRGALVGLVVGEALQDADELVRHRRVPLRRLLAFAHRRLVLQQHRIRGHEEACEPDREQRTDEDPRRLVAELQDAVGAEARPGRAVLLHVAGNARRDEQHGACHQPDHGIAQADRGHDDDRDDERRRDRIRVAD